ncbi:ParB/RepB/Spo0J family partition protein [Streptomyces sp. BH104]|uniref:ParB/RepB/Spo0J family partition protein n=1 Tax=Streptomyces sp. BH104 TaxID=3410407 RepID=UPI003BB6507B
MTDTITPAAAEATPKAAKATARKTAPKKETAKRPPATRKKAAKPKAVAKAAEPAKASTRAEATADLTKAVLKTIPRDRIDRDPDQPRKVFDQAKLEELAESMRELGQLQAITVRYVPGSRRYVIVMGERRWRAAEMAGLTEMHAMVLRGLDGGAETFARSVAENVGRADMTPLEEAEAFQKMRDEYGYEVDDIAKRVGRSWNYVDLRLKLLDLVPAVQEALLKGHIPVGLAWYVAQISAANQQAFIARWTRGQFPSIRDAETFCQKVRSEEEQAKSQSVMFVLADEEAATGSGERSMFPELELSVDERERIVSDRHKLVKKIEKLSVAGEILTEIAAMDPAELALLLSGAHGGIPGNRMRIDHLKNIAAKASTNIRQASAVAEVRAGALRLVPEAEAEADVA